MAAGAGDAAPGGLLRIGEALLDLETRFYTPVPALESELRATTALPEVIPNAEYLFYPRLTEADLPDLAAAAVGEMLFPDRAATIILGCQFGDTVAAPHNQAVALRLSGPGIQGATDIHVSGLPEGFWTLREQRRRYPLGWDLFLVDGWQVIGIPRSTHIERIG
jgi:alpha-D-ribose 1-methylphosphonate 5-triphosphate synthase subunit PhnH